MDECTFVLVAVVAVLGAGFVAGVHALLLAHFARVGVAVAVAVAVSAAVAFGFARRAGFGVGLTFGFFFLFGFSGHFFLDGVLV